jgi:hypothetical protein
LYVGWLNKHIKYDHRHGMHTFMIDGQEWRLGSNVRAGFVCEVVPHSIVADLWGEAERAQRATRENKMSKAARDKWGEKLAAVDRVFAETNDDNYMLGYMYGVLEWAASVVRVPCPTMTDVVAAPARHVAPLVVACHDGATRYTPPPKERGRPSNVFPPTSAKSVVKAWLDHVLTLSTARLSSLRAAPLGVEELPAFALGYAHSLRERGPRRYHYTAALVAELAGAPLSAVRRAAAKVPGREPLLDLRSLRSVIAWVSRQRACRGLGAL